MVATILVLGGRSWGSTEQFVPGLEGCRNPTRNAASTKSVPRTRSSSLSSASAIPIHHQK